MSPKRVESIEVSQSQLRLTLVGRAEEVVTMTAVANGKLNQYKCILSKGGHVILNIPSGQCEYN